MGEKEFTPTPNVRNPAMLEEAEAFSKHMLGFKRSLRTYQVEIAGENGEVLVGTERFSHSRIIHSLL